MPIDHQQRQPVVGGAFRQRHRQDHHAEDQQLAIAQLMAYLRDKAAAVRLFAAFAVAGRWQVAQRHSGDQHIRQQHGGKMKAGADIRGGHRQPGQRARQRAEAEKAVNNGHDRAVQRPFERGALDVDHHIHQRRAAPQQRQAGKDAQRARYRQAERHQHQPDQQHYHAVAHHPLRAELGDQLAGQQHAEH